MVRRPRSRGFTLVELLVVISIIGMLMSLLLPAVQSARESGRRTTCANNMHQISLAALNYESNKRCYPGVVNTVNGGTYSYIVPLFPYLERNDLWNSVMGNNAASQASGLQTPFVALFVCPSDPPDTTTVPALAYTVNAGATDNTAQDLPPSPSPPAPAGKPNWTAGNLQATGVCFDQSNNAGNFYIKIGQDYLGQNDGASNTLLVAENIQADQWYFSLSGVSGQQAIHRAFALRTGFMHCMDGSTGIITTPTTGPRRINYQKTSQVPALTSALTLARPSSNHTGGVNVNFCDGHYRYVGEDIDPTTFAQLMSSNNNGTVLPSSVLLNDRNL